MKNKVQALALAASGLLASAKIVMAQEKLNRPAFFFADATTLINSILNFVMILGALLVFMYLIWGGIEWITSGGDKGKTEGARNKITAAVIGLVVLASSWAILGIVLRLLNAGSFEDLINDL